MSQETTEELNPSELGTLDFWEAQYSKEIENFKDHGDVGEVWFGEQTAKRVVSFITNKLKIGKEERIIDIGCGNGVTLLELGEKGFENLLGVDYSEKAIQLAEAILRENDLKDVKLQAVDFLDKEQLREFTGGFRVAHDKGTYDAISLSPDNSSVKRKKYMENVCDIVAPDGYFIITSCNWTKQELVKHFENYFQFQEELVTKTFQFGGNTGNTVTQLVFKKIS